MYIVRSRVEQRYPTHADLQWKGTECYRGSLYAFFSTPSTFFCAGSPFYRVPDHGSLSRRKSGCAVLSHSNCHAYGRDKRDLSEDVCDGAIRIVRFRRRHKKCWSIESHC
jgi:hypothetical protein